MFRKGKFIEMEGASMFAWVWGRQQGWTANGHRGSFRGVVKFLKFNRMYKLW